MLKLFVWLLLLYLPLMLQAVFFGMDFMWIPIGLSMIASNLLILREKEKQNTYVFRKESY